MSESIIAQKDALGRSSDEVSVFQHLAPKILAEGEGIMFEAFDARTKAGLEIQVSAIPENMMRLIHYSGVRFLPPNYKDLPKSVKDYLREDADQNAGNQTSSLYYSDDMGFPIFIVLNRPSALCHELIHLAQDHGDVEIKKKLLVQVAHHGDRLALEIGRKLLEAGNGKRRGPLHEFMVLAKEISDSAYGRTTRVRRDHEEADKLENDLHTLLNRRHVFADEVYSAAGRIFGLGSPDNPSIWSALMARGVVRNGLGIVQLPVCDELTAYHFETCIEHISPLVNSALKTLGCRVLAPMPALSRPATQPARKHAPTPA